MLIGRVSANLVVTRPRAVSADATGPLATVVQAGRRRERQPHARLQVRLVEAGEELARVGRDEQRVEVVAAVGRVVASDDARAGGRDVGHEAEVELVLAGAEQASGDDGVAISDGGRPIGRAVGGGTDEAAAAEVEDDVPGALVSNRTVTRPGGAVEGREVELQIVADVGDGRGAVTRERV